MIKIVFTDLDGTLLDNEKKISSRNFETFDLLKKQNIICVAATGRAIASVRNVVPENFPFDYIIFSSGAGVARWDNNDIIFERHLSATQVKQVADVLIKNNINFMIQAAIPNNHHFKYHITDKLHQDFIKRVENANNKCQQIDYESEKFEMASQFILILDTVEQFNEIKKLFTGIKIIRATSPIDGKSIWMELFHQDVSKGATAEWLCNYLSIDKAQSLAIGNDYNDLELLNFAAVGYMVDNAPDDIKNGFKNCPSNINDGVAIALKNEILFRINK